MKKKKSNKFLKFLIRIIIIIIIGLFVLNYFDIINLEDYNIFSKTKDVIIDKIVEVKKVNIVDESSDSRVYAVSINNHHSSWPHAGLQESFINYELLAEGGITRIIALYKDKDTDKIGSIRSARHYFLDYVLENDAIFVHYGESPQAKKDLESLSIDNIDGYYYDSAFYRDTSRNVAFEHTAFTTMNMIEKAVENKGYRTTSNNWQLLKYSVDEIDLSKYENALKADNINIKYSSYQTTSYKYNEEEKVYYLSMNDEAHIDEITGKQYTAKNIIIYNLNYTTIDNAGRQNLDNIGTGEGYFITNGYAVNITWNKTSRSSKTKYMLPTGEELIVNDGNTWIHIMPTTYEAQITSNVSEEGSSEV
jgi:hypothetical protein